MSEQTNDRKSGLSTAADEIESSFSKAQQETPDYAIDLDLKTTGRVNFASAQNDIPVVKSMSLTNPGTIGTVQSVPRLDSDNTRVLHAIPGNPPDMQHLPAGCAYQERCEFQHEICLTKRPPLQGIT